MSRADELNVLAYGIEALLKLPVPDREGRYAWEADRRASIETMREAIERLGGEGEK